MTDKPKLPHGTAGFPPRVSHHQGVEPPRILELRNELQIPEGEGPKPPEGHNPKPPGPAQLFGPDGKPILEADIWDPDAEEVASPAPQAQHARVATNPLKFGLPQERILQGRVGSKGLPLLDGGFKLDLPPSPTKVR